MLYLKFNVRIFPNLSNKKFKEVNLVPKPSHKHSGSEQTFDVNWIVLDMYDIMH
jgi:hypothetical protein